MLQFSLEKDANENKSEEKKLTGSIDQSASSVRIPPDEMSLGEGFSSVNTLLYWSSLFDRTHFDFFSTFDEKWRLK